MRPIYWTWTFAVGWFLLCSANATVLPTAASEELLSCGENDFQCSSKCIPNSWRCDGDTDCLSGEDEQNCTDDFSTCQPGMFQCSREHGRRCIPVQWRCDGEVDCSAGDDEQNCTEPFYNCNATTHFACPPSSLKNSTVCIPISWKCDGQADCSEGEDEENCPKTETSTAGEQKCGAEEFQCDDGRCIHSQWRCDHDADCEDSSDERNCNVSTCSADQFQCQLNEYCIPIRWQCDGEKDCADGSDELGQQCGTVPTCGADEFWCEEQNKCMSKQLWCDGKVVCVSSNNERATSCSFEQKANNESCNSAEEFDCGTHCIPLAKLCDGKPDCLTPTNEAAKDETENFCEMHRIQRNCTEFNGGCEQICTTVYNSGICSCRKGYLLVNHTLCEDIDECEVSGTCDQLCINLPGSYECSCYKNYVLQEDQKVCRTLSTEHPKLLITARRNILQIDPDTKEYFPVVENLTSAVALDYVYKTDTIIWSDVQEKVINWCDDIDITLNESETLTDGCPRPLVTAGVETPDGLAIDWVHELLFWTDNGAAKKLNVMKLYSKVPLIKTVFTEDMDEPRAIAVDPKMGMIFWTDWGVKPKIESAGMDGSFRTIVVDTDIKWPNGLTLDILGNRIYWADAKLRWISTSDYDGQHRQVVLENTPSLGHPFGLGLFEEQIFWSDWNTDGVYRVNKFTGDNIETIISGIRSPMMVRVHHPTVQPDFPNLCASNSCAHLCLPTLQRKDEIKYRKKILQPYTCHCSNGFELDNSGRLCRDKAGRQEGFPKLLVASVNTIFQINPSTKEYYPLVENLTAAVALDYLYKQDAIIWSDVQKDVITWCDGDNVTLHGDKPLDDNCKRSLATQNVSMPTGLAVDWVHSLLFWTDSEFKTLSVSQLYSRTPLIKTLFHEDLDKPRAVCVDPKIGMIFWSDWGEKPKIESSGMDGSVRRIVVDTDIGWPNGLAVDILDRRFYWIDAKLNRISSSDYEGRHRQTVLANSPGLKHPFGLGIFENQVFWTDWSTDSVYEANKFSGRDAQTIISGLRNPMMVRVYHPMAQPDFPNLCTFHDCEQLCLPTSQNKDGFVAERMNFTESFTCQCADGFQLEKDRRSCSNGHWKKEKPISFIHYLFP